MDKQFAVGQVWEDNQGDEFVITQLRTHENCRYPVVASNTSGEVLTFTLDGVYLLHGSGDYDLVELVTDVPGDNSYTATAEGDLKHAIALLVGGIKIPRHAFAVCNYIGRAYAAVGGEGKASDHLFNAQTAMEDEEHTKASELLIRAHEQMQS